MLRYLSFTFALLALAACDTAPAVDSATATAARGSGLACFTAALPPKASCDELCATTDAACVAVGLKDGASRLPMPARPDPVQSADVLCGCCGVNP
jgi:hypothetical protein